MTRPDPGHAAIIISAYNAETTLARAVDSALRQSGVSEVCVVDDGSSDATHAVARACDDRGKRLTILRLDENAGPSAARNLAIASTTAPWLSVLDADDYMLEGRIERLLAMAGDADFIADHVLRVPDGSDAEPARTGGGVGISPRPLDFKTFVEGNLASARRLDLGFLKPLMRRAFLDAHRIRYAEILRLGEDYELYARALALGARFVIAAPQGYVSVDRPGSLSNRHAVDDLRELRDCDARLAALRKLTAEERRALRRHYDSVDRRLQWRLLIEAVKAHDFAAALRTFRSPGTAQYLAVRLAEQAWLRSLASVGLRPGDAKRTAAARE